MNQIVGATHPGKRDHNEDCYIADTTLGLGLVADGMGGYACGEVASELVRETVAAAVANSEALRDAIARAHAVVKGTAATDTAKKGMGSTVVAFRLQGQDYELAWVGDSRAYLWDAMSVTLHQITRDHSYVETLVASGAISHEEATRHPNRNLITQAVGVAGDDGLEIELIRGRLGPRQQLLICSDGLVDEVRDGEIATILAAAESLDQAVATLVERALHNGGSDNVTVVMAVAGQSEQPAVEPDIVRSIRAGVVPNQGGGDVEASVAEDSVVEDSASKEQVLLSSAVDNPADKMSPPGVRQSLKAMGFDLTVLGLGCIVLLVLAVVALLSL